LILYWGWETADAKVEEVNYGAVFILSMLLCLACSRLVADFMQVPLVLYQRLVGVV
jgi:hypothetical protein